MIIGVCCKAARNRKCGGLGAGSGRLGVKKGCARALGDEGALWHPGWGDCRCEGQLFNFSLLEGSPSKSMSGGSGLSSKAGIPLGMYFSLVNLKAPEYLRKSARAAMPLGVPRSSGNASSWFVSCRVTC